MWIMWFLYGFTNDDLTDRQAKFQAMIMNSQQYKSSKIVDFKAELK